MVMRIIKDVAEDIEEELEGAEHYMRTALLYKGYIFIFSEENVLITMYKNEKVIV